MAQSLGIDTLAVRTLSTVAPEREDSPVTLKVPVVRRDGPGSPLLQGTPEEAHPEATTKRALQRRRTKKAPERGHAGGLVQGESKAGHATRHTQNPPPRARHTSAINRAHPASAQVRGAPRVSTPEEAHLEIAVPEGRLGPLCRGK